MKYNFPIVFTLNTIFILFLISASIKCNNLKVNDLKKFTVDFRDVRQNHKKIYVPNSGYFMIKLNLSIGTGYNWFLKSLPKGVVCLNCSAYGCGEYASPKRFINGFEIFGGQGHSIFKFYVDERYFNKYQNNEIVIQQYQPAFGNKNPLFELTAELVNPGNIHYSR